jgi:hypothetical protein
MPLSKSNDRHNFNRDSYLRRCEAENTAPNEDYLKLFDELDLQTDKLEADPEWCKNNLEYDLRTNVYMLDKVRSDDVYAQNLYAALCNNDFQRLDTWPILKGETWSCTWRYAGGIIADMRQQGDYMDWYCSGIRAQPDEEYLATCNEHELADYKQTLAHVDEGFVTDEISNDLQKMGWTVIKWDGLL